MKLLYRDNKRRRQPPSTREYPESIPSGPAETMPLSESLSKCQNVKDSGGDAGTPPLNQEPSGPVKQAKEERSLTQAEIAQRILEFVGKEGKPLKQVFEYAVKGLGLRRPEPLLRELLERGHLVKVKKGGETWLVRG